MKALSLACGALLLAYGLLQAIASQNQALHQNLCRYWLCWDRQTTEDTYARFLNGVTSSKDSVRALTNELVRDPASSYRWCDLADALLEDGDEKKARYCMQRAAELGPYSAPVLLRVANFNLRVGETTAALQMFKRILEITPAYDGIAFSALDRFSGGIDQTLSLAIPSNERAAQAYFSHLIAGSRDMATLSKTWDWMDARKFTGGRMSIDYVNHLINRHEYDRAARIWTRASGEHRGDYLRPNRIFNASYEYAPSGAILDWNVNPPEGVESEWDLEEHASGARSLRLTFKTDANLAFNHVFECAVVTPGAYRFEVSVKSDRLTTDQGVGFHIYDAEQAARLDAATEPVRGTVPWTRQVVSFRVGPETRLLRVEIRRMLSRKIENQIQGRFWADGLKLYPIL